MEKLYSENFNEYPLAFSEVTEVFFQKFTCQGKNIYQIPRDQCYSLIFKGLVAERVLIMVIPGNGIFVVRGELSSIMTAMKRGSRWSSHSYVKLASLAFAKGLMIYILVRKPR